MLKLGYNGDFKDEEMAKIQILKLRNSDGFGEATNLSMTLTSMNLSKLLTTITITLNYCIKFSQRKYEKVLNIHFDVARAMRFRFKPSLKSKPIEELGYEGAKQNMFNFVHIMFSLGDKVIENQETTVNPTTPPQIMGDFKFGNSGLELNDAKENAKEKNSTYSQQLSFKKNKGRLIMDPNHTTIITYDVMSKFPMSPIKSRSSKKKRSEVTLTSDDSFLGTFNTQNSIFENIRMPIQKKYSLTSLNSVVLGSTTLGGGTKDSIVSHFDEVNGEEKEYFYFERPEGDTEKSISRGFSKNGSIFEKTNSMSDKRFFSDLDQMVME